jgi:hypothetical protein
MLGVFMFIGTQAWCVNLLAGHGHGRGDGAALPVLLGLLPAAGGLKRTASDDLESKD